MVLQVIVKGCCSELGLEVVKLVARARDLEVAGAVDQTHIGDDIGLVAGLSEPLELPVTDDLTVAMASISQNRKRGMGLSPRLFGFVLGLGQVLAALPLWPATVTVFTFVSQAFL